MQTPMLFLELGELVLLCPFHCRHDTRTLNLLLPTTGTSPQLKPPPTLHLQWQKRLLKKHPQQQQKPKPLQMLQRRRQQLKRQPQLRLNMPLPLRQQGWTRQRRLQRQRQPLLPL
uniref:Uncharacterized protein n=1 Tax=Toxoplasma gondii COUG TaxID=1074873 RepID=A0A2G8XZH5_TOXGO|nr:hypothetical protein TGCOUG_393610 [Toxoplasma gondii COUG]